MKTFSPCWPSKSDEEECLRQFNAGKDVVVLLPMDIYTQIKSDQILSNFNKDPPSSFLQQQRVTKLRTKQSVRCS